MGNEDGCLKDADQNLLRTTSGCVDANNGLVKNDASKVQGLTKLTDLSTFRFGVSSHRQQLFYSCKWVI